MTDHKLGTVAPVVSLVPNIGSIKPPVQNFLTSKDWKMPIEEVKMPGISLENISESYEKFDKGSEKYRKKYTEVIFY